MATEDLRVRVLLDDADFRAGIRNMVSSMRETQSQAGNMRGAFNGIAESMKAMASVWIGMNLAEGLKDAVTEGIKYNMMLEDATTKWTTLDGNADKAKQTVKDLQDLALGTNFDFEGVDQVATSLTMAGIGGADLSKNVMRVSDALSAIGKGGDTEAITGIARAIQQMGAKGKVSAEEINQMGERGINGWKLMAMAQMGLTDASDMNSDAVTKQAGAMMKLASEGKFLAKDGIPLLLKGMDLYAGATKRTQGNMSATIARIKEMKSMLMGQITIGLFNGLKPVLDSVYKKMGDVMNVFKALNGNLSPNDVSYQQWVKFNAIADRLRTIFDGIKLVVKPLWQTIKKGLSDIGKAFGKSNNDSRTFLQIMKFIGQVLNFFLAPIIQGIVNVIVGLRKAWLGIVEIWKGFAHKDGKMIWDGIKKLFMGGLQAIWGAVMLYLAPGGGGKIMGIFSKFGGAVLKWVGGIIPKLLGGFAKFFTHFSVLLGAWGRNFLSKVMSTVGKVLSAIIKWGSDLLKGVQSAWNKVISFMEHLNLGSIGRALGQKLINGFKSMFAGIGSWIQSKLSIFGGGGSSGGSSHKSTHLTVNNYSPKHLSPSETARSYNATLARYSNKW